MRPLLFLLLIVTLRAGWMVPVAPTGSMKPLFDENYYLMVELRDFKDIKVGDIIIYHSHRTIMVDGVPHHNIVHPVYQRSSGGSIVRCWGVNNPEPDSEFITEEMYIGTVTAWVRCDDYLRSQCDNKPPCQWTREPIEIHK